MPSQKQRLNDAIVLLEGALQILKKAREGAYAKNVFALTAFYDNAECDGLCLMQDIEDFLSEIHNENLGT